MCAAQNVGICKTCKLEIKESDDDEGYECFSCGGLFHLECGVGDKNINTEDFQLQCNGCVEGEQILKNKVDQEMKEATKKLKKKKIQDEKKLEELTKEEKIQLAANDRWLRVSEEDFEETFNEVIGINNKEVLDLLDPNTESLIDRIKSDFKEVVCGERWEDVKNMKKEEFLTKFLEAQVSRGNDCPKRNKKQEKKSSGKLHANKPPNKRTTKVAKDPVREKMEALFPESGSKDWMHDWYSTEGLTIEDNLLIVKDLRIPLENFEFKDFNAFPNTYVRYRRDSDRKPPGECRICFQPYTSNGSQKPKTLSCSHTFCTMCLLITREEGTLVCPACQAIHNFQGIHESADEKDSEKARQSSFARREKELFDKSIQIEKTLIENERKVEKFISVSKLVNSKLQEAKKSGKDRPPMGKACLMLLLLEENRIMSQVQENLESIQAKLTEVLHNMRVAESSDEMKLKMLEAGLYSHVHNRWEALFTERQPELHNLFQKTRELLRYWDSRF